MNKKRYIAIIILYMLLAQVPLYASQRNLALNKKLEYSPKPTYHLTEHSHDPYLLTDGIIGKSLWYESYRQKTVGWGWINESTIEISIDLEKTYNIDKVKIYTVGGGRSDVEYPEYISVLISRDGDGYSLASVEFSENLIFGTNNVVPKTFVLPVEQSARYIKILVKPTGRFFFTDEIEVIESKTENSVNTNPEFLNKKNSVEVIEKISQIQKDFDNLKSKFSRLANSSDLRQMDKAVADLKQNPASKKVSQLESKLPVFRSRLLNSIYDKDWFCYLDDPTEILRYGDLPPENINDPNISLYQWQDEYGSAAINIVNSSPSEVTFRLNLSPIDDNNGKEIDPKDVFELRRAAYVNVLNAGLVADPLLLQGTKSFSVPPGQMVQIWLEARSHGLKAGKYKAALAISAQGDNLSENMQTVPINLEIANKKFPQKMPFRYCNWDYVTLSNRFTGKNQEFIKAAVKDLNDHYINVVVIRHNHLFRDLNSRMLSTSLGTQIARRKSNNPFFLIFLGGKPHLEKKFGALQTAEWEANFKNFLSQLRDFMLAQDLGYDRFALYPFDESVGEDFQYVAKAIRKFDPQLKIYANHWIKPSEIGKLKDLIDIWCPHIPDVIANKSYFERYRSLNFFEEIWCYMANLPAERYFAPEKTVTSRQWQGRNEIFWRTMPLVAASYKITGAGFWVYSDSDRSGWNKNSPGEYGVIYDGSKIPDKDCIYEPIVPSRRWQLWREGVEDAVALQGHPDLLKEFMAKPVKDITSDYLQSLRKRADSN